LLKSLAPALQPLVDSKDHSVTVVSTVGLGR
jgi:hypothetical protein